MLSRHGAGIFSTKKLAPQSVLIVRSVETNQEAAVRVIDRVAGTPEGFTYGVAFLDPSVNFWNVEFAPQPEAEAGAKSMLLECTSCHEREAVHPNDVELDVYAINKSVSRFCANCGTPTSWKEVSGAIETKPSSPAATKDDTKKDDAKKEPPTKRRQHIVRRTGAKTFAPGSTLAPASAIPGRRRSSPVKIYRAAASASGVPSVTSKSR